jgi:rhomboid protease GluP
MEEHEQYLQGEEPYREERVQTPVLKPIITYILIAINVIMFLITFAYGSINKVDANFIFGEKVNSLIMQGEYWRLFMPIFLHEGIMHLAVNSFSLYAVGPTVESIYGRRKFLLIYLVAGIMGNVASFIFSTVPSLGASGAIFGLMGALLYLLQRNKGSIKSSFGTSIIAIIVINLVYGFSNSGIDNFAHLGGLTGGYLSAFALGFAWERRADKKRIFAWVLILVLIFGGLFVGFNTGTNLALNLLNQASKNFDSKDYKKAEELAHKVESLRISNTDLQASMYDLLAASLINQDNPQPAFEYAKKLVDLNPERGDYLLGFCYLKSGDNVNAKAEFEKAYKINPSNTEIKGILDSLK